MIKYFLLFAFVFRISYEATNFSAFAVGFDDLDRVIEEYKNIYKYCLSEVLEYGIRKGNDEGIVPNDYSILNKDKLE